MTSSSTSITPDLSNLLPEHIQNETVRQWLADDVPSFDVGGYVVGNTIKTAQLWMKSTGVFAGKPFFNAVFTEVGCQVKWEENVAVEGQVIQADGSKVLLATVEGPIHALLRGERTALNTLSRCSGVATAANHAISLAQSKHWSGQIAGTRKTTPGFRIVEKYGLLVGGAATHRLDLSQMVMLKDNHIWACGGSIEGAVKRARKACGFSAKIEVECGSLEDACKAAEAGADIVMLDNFAPTQLHQDAQTFKAKHPHVLVEASGGITLETLPNYMSDNVDVISQGSLTQGYKCLDFSLKVVH